MWGGGFGVGHVSVMIKAPQIYISVGRDQRLVWLVVYVYVCVCHPSFEVCWSRPSVAISFVGTSGLRQLTGVCVMRHGVSSYGLVAIFQIKYRYISQNSSPVNDQEVEQQSFF